jgi:arylsulfatase A-like enzyme
MIGNKITRRSFLRTSALGSAAVALNSRIKAQSAKLPRKPNLIVLIPDQLRPDTIDCYGAPHAYAPSLNQLAAQSFVFEQAYVTQPICTSSRSSLQTGTWPSTNGCTHNTMRLDPRFRCLPELINDRDYRTAYMGKWHLGDELFVQHGFDEWVSIMDDMQMAYGPGRDRNTISDYSKFLFSKGLEPSGKEKGYFSHAFASRLPIELSKPKFLEMRACDFLERHARDPFVLFVAFYEPHPPYNGPLNNLYPLEQMDVDPTARQILGEDMPRRYRIRQREDARDFGTTPSDYQRVKQKYLGLVTELDRSVGAILSKLEQLGLADNTIVIHTSDHGEMMGAHRLFGKEVFFQEAIRVPYLVRMPNQRRAIRIAQPVSHIDFAPTILDLLGKPPHEQCVGKSRAPLIRETAMPIEPVFVQWAPNFPARPSHHAIKTAKEKEQEVMSESSRAVISPDGWKLCLRDLDKNELYNLRTDPREEKNLYAPSEQKEVITRLTDVIHRWQESIEDSLKV